MRISCRRLNQFVLAVCFLAVMRAAPAASGPAIIAITSGVTNGVAKNFVVGWEFTVATDITVTHVGVFDQNRNGTLDEPAASEVGIWTTGQTLLVATNVPLATVAENDVFYVPVEPLVLTPGSYVIGAVNMIGGERFWVQATVETDPRITWTAGRFLETTTLQFPTSRAGEPPRYFGPNFKIVAEPLRITTPTTRSVQQRDRLNYATLDVTGTYGTDLDAVHVRAEPMAGYSGATVPQQVLDAAPHDGAFAGSLTLQGGWYRIEAIGFSGGMAVSTATVERVGVGEVFVAAGQSNSANYGNPAQNPTDDRVSSVSTNQVWAWRFARDPQPSASGAKGSPWPAFGSALAGTLDVPVGIIPVGVGGTMVGAWHPVTGTLYPRLEAALNFVGSNGCRAVLWHQGETDSKFATGTSNYVERLEAVIAQSRVDAGFDVPWGVAIASYNPSATAQAMAEIRAAQQQVIDNDPLVFLGAQTDGYRALGYLWDGIHFNAAGLTDHGQQWAELVRAFSFPKPAEPVRMAALTMSESDACGVVWDAETNVTYQVQQTSDIMTEPVAWSNASGWIVGPDDTDVVPCDEDTRQTFFRVLLPHTDY